MHCNTVTTFKVGKLTQNSITFHSCMYVHLFNVHPTRRMLCPWPKIWIQLLLLLSKIFNFHIWDQSDSESLTFGKAWTQRASGLLESLYFEFSVSNLWVAEDEDRGVAPSAGFTSLFYVQASALREREGVVPMHSTHNADILRRASVIFLQYPFYPLLPLNLTYSLFYCIQYRSADWKAPKVYFKHWSPLILENIHD